MTPQRPHPHPDTTLPPPHITQHHSSPFPGGHDGPLQQRGSLRYPISSGSKGVDLELGMNGTPALSVVVQCRATQWSTRFSQSYRARNALTSVFQVDRPIRGVNGMTLRRRDNKPNSAEQVSRETNSWSVERDSSLRIGRWSRCQYALGGEFLVWCRGLRGVWSLAGERGGVG